MDLTNQDPRTRDASEATQQERPARGGQDFAVVVGIEDYSHLTSLGGVASDVRGFCDWLRHKHGGGLRPENVKLVLSNAERKAHEQLEIDKELLSVLTAAQRLGGGRRLYFYFSGHGATSRNSGHSVALLLTPWSSDLVGFALNAELYASTLCAAGLFEEIAIFVDSCRSHVPRVVGVKPTFRNEWPLPQPHATRRFMAYAAEASQPAFESTTLVGSHGIFTGCLLSILRQELDAGIHAHRLKARLEDEVMECARQQRVFQRAHVQNELLKHSRFGEGRPRPVLEKLLSPEKLAQISQLPSRVKRVAQQKLAWIAPSPRLELRFATRRGKVVIRDHKLSIVAEHIASSKSWWLRLPLGVYQVEGEHGEGPTRFRHDGRRVSHDV